MSQLEEDIKQSKYDLLQQEILDKGYDPIAFQIFCELIKKDGSDDVDFWLYEELQETIHKFKIQEDSLIVQRRSSHNNTAEKSSKQQFLRQEEQETKVQSQQTPNKSQDNNKFQQDFQVIRQSDESTFKLELDCRKPDRTKLTDYILENPNKRVKIIMNEFITKQEGLFSTGYGAFKILTQPIGWIVWRRFSDFAWLREVLQKAFPCQLIPPIPKKKIKVNSTGQSYLEKRMKVMELFLQNLLHHPLLRTHPALTDFLSISDESLFKEGIVQHDRAAIPQGPSEFITSSGKCQLEITPELNAYSNTLHDYLKNSGELYNKLQESFRKVFLDLDQLSTTLQNIGAQFTQLSKISSVFFQTSKYKFVVQIEKAQRVYNELSVFMDGWYQNITFQMKNVKENFYEFFCYHGQMQEQALEFVNQRNTLHSKYRDCKSKLNDKKEKSFLQGDTNKWELSVDIPKTVKELQQNKHEAFKYMFANETKHLNDLKENFAFINRQTVEEMNQVMEFRVETYADKFIRVAQMRGLDIAKLHHVLADFLINMFEIQGEFSGSLQKRESIYTDSKNDTFFGMKPNLDV